MFISACKMVMCLPVMFLNVIRPADLFAKQNYDHFKRSLIFDVFLGFTIVHDSLFMLSYFHDH